MLFTLFVQVVSCTPHYQSLLPDFFGLEHDRPILPVHLVHTACVHTVYTGGGDKCSVRESIIRCIGFVYAVVRGLIKRAANNGGGNATV